MEEAPAMTPPTKMERDAAYTKAVDRAKGLERRKPGDPKIAAPRFLVFDGSVGPLDVEGHLLLVAASSCFLAKQAVQIFLQRAGAGFEIIERISLRPFLANGQIFNQVVLVSKAERSRDIDVEVYDFEAMRKEMESESGSG